MGPISTTNDRDFEASQLRSPWDVLSSMLRKELGPEFELLLAKPVQHDGVTDWYVELDEDAVPFSKLGEEQRDALKARLDGMRRQVLAYADRLVAPNARSRDPQTAKDLKLAMEIDTRYVYSVNGRPALVAWGLEPRGGRRVTAGGLTEWLSESGLPRTQISPKSAEGNTREEVLAAPLVVVGPSLVSRLPWAVLFWLLFFGLVGTSYFLLLQGCAFSSTGAGAWLARILPNSCSAEAALPNLASEIARRDQLIGQIRDAELDMARIEASCSSAAAKQPRQAAQKRACTEVHKRLQDNGAQSGQLEITLQWNGLEDLDLWAECPGGRAAANPNNGGACGSTPDIDWNYGDHQTEHPIEHIVWKTNPPVGRYEVQVLYFDPKGPDHPLDFDVFVKRNGVVQGPFHGVVHAKRETVKPYSFIVGPNDEHLPQIPQSQQCDAG